MHLIKQSGVAVLALAMMSSASAAELRFSGFGTLGMAVSDREFTHQRFINDQPTLKRDSLLGLQADLRLNPQWGATVQGVLAPKADSDSGLEVDARWAFVSYRPHNDWLFRAGKLRVGSFLNMQNMEVGTTYDMLRLPAEVYSVAPMYDFWGASVNKTFYYNDFEFNIEGVWGQTDATWRQYLNGRQEANFLPIEIDVKGFVFTTNYDEDIYRFGYFHVTPNTVSGGDRFVSKYDVTPTPLGFDIITPNHTDKTNSKVITLGASIELFDNYRLTSEYARRIVDEMETGPDSHGFYANLSASYGRWTPYITYAKIWSNESQLKRWREVRDARPPTAQQLQLAAMAQGESLTDIEAQYAANQAATGYQDAASGIFVFDQHSVMLGTAYSLTPLQKIKVEIMQTRVGEVSSLIDANISNKAITTFSLSYSFAF